MDPILKEALEKGKKNEQGQVENAFIDFKEGNLLEICLGPDGIDLENFGVKSPDKPILIEKLSF